MTIYEKIVFMTIWVVIHLFFSVGYIKTNKIIKTGILALDMIAMWRMYDYFISKNNKVLYLADHSAFSNFLVLLLYILIVSIIGLILKKEKLEKCIKSLAVAGLAIGAALCLYDTNIEQSSLDYFYGKPYLTIKQLAADPESYDNAYAYSTENFRRNLIIKRAYITMEMLPYANQSENFGIKAIYTVYYELSSKYVLPEMLMEELTGRYVISESLMEKLTDGNAALKWEKIDSDFFDDIRYHVLYMNNEKDVYIIYRYKETVVKVEVFVEKDYDIENIINCLESMYGAA